MMEKDIQNGSLVYKASVKKCKDRSTFWLLISQCSQTAYSRSHLERFSKKLFSGKFLVLMLSTILLSKRSITALHTIYNCNTRGSAMQVLSYNA